MKIKKMFSDKREFSRAAAMIVFVIMTGQTYSKFQEFNHRALIQESGVLDPFRLTIIGFGLVAFALGVLILGSFAETSEKVNLKVPVIKALVTIGLILLVVGSIGLVLAAALSLM
ncbi:MAG: hypothetical protein ISP89_09950 [Pseudomonadales bacterium]|nr:hypothetical protein [Pseudomonadales bacterium]